jgi:hypothetical protein
VSSRDPTRTVHFAIAKRLEILMRRTDGYSSDHRYPPFERLVRDGADFADRDHYATTVAVAWYAIAFLSFAVAAVVMYPLTLLVGDEASRITAVVILAFALSCCGGGVNALWRKYWHIPRARRARAFGEDSEQYAAAMRRTLPRNTSLISQLAIGVFAVVAAL